MAWLVNLITGNRAVQWALGVAAALAAFWANNARQRSIGRTQQRIEQNEAVHEAQKRMAKVDRLDRRELIERLRTGGF